MFVLSLIVLLAYIFETSGHSWIACSDYTEKNGRYWDPKKCRGYARDSSKYSPHNSFGLDLGITLTKTLCVSDKVYIITYIKFNLYKKLIHFTFFFCFIH